MSVASKEFFRYLAVSEVDRQWGLYITGAGHLTVAAGAKYPHKTHPSQYQFSWPQRRVLPEYQLLYIVKGRGEFESQHVAKQDVQENTAILTFPNEWHSYRPAPAVGWIQLWFGFNGEIADRILLREFISHQNPISRIVDCNGILRSFGRLLDQVQSPAPGFQQLLAGIVMEILAGVVTAARFNKRAGRHWQLVERVKAAMEPETAEKQTIEHLSRSVGLSQAQLRRVFKNQTGLSPYQYRMQVRVNRAKELLQSTALSVKEIASILNFQNPYHFSAVFKKKTDMAPTHWRNGTSLQNKTDCNEATQWM